MYLILFQAFKARIFQAMMFTVCPFKNYLININQCQGMAVIFTLTSYLTLILWKEGLSKPFGPASERGECQSYSIFATMALKATPCQQLHLDTQ